MATTQVFSGTASVAAQLQAALGGDKGGNEQISLNKNITWAAAGGTAPTLSGFWKGTAVCAAGDWLMAHASDPLQAMGDAAYSQGFAPAGSKLKMLYIENLDGTNSITVIQGATNGLTGLFDSASHGVTIPPGGFVWLFMPAGLAALTTGSNDKLTISVSGGTPNAIVVAAYGP